MKFLPLYFIYISTFAMASLEKFSLGVPEWFTKQFEASFLTQLPGGISFSFYMIALLEALTAILFSVSLLQLVLKSKHSLFFLKLGFFSAICTFAGLGFGLRLTHDFNGAFQLFCYALLSFFALCFAEKNAQTA
jgi:hypothetical protein